MLNSHFEKLFHYEKWANDKVLIACLGLEEMPPRVGRVFAHLLSAQKIWLNRLQEQPQNQAVWPDYPPEAWSKILNAQYQEIIQWIRSLNESDFQRAIGYKNSKGVSFSTSIQDILQHLLLHAAYHRGQIIVLIKPLLEQIPASDYIFYLRDPDFLKLPG